MTATAVQRGRTLRQLASVMGGNEYGHPVSLKEARALLAEMENTGLLERVGPQTWRLSDAADQRYGYWLRQWPERKE